MTFKLGSTDINKIYLGSTEIKKIYLGSTLVYDTLSGGGGGGAWNPSGFTSTGAKSFSITSDLPSVTNPNDVTFMDSGNSFCVVSNQDDDVHVFDMSTAYDPSTATYASAKNYTVTESVAIDSVKFNTAGTLMFVGSSFPDRVYTYSLSTAWNPSTATFVREFTPANNLGSFCFNSDGSVMYVINTASGSTDTIEQYDLSSAYDTSTASANGTYNIGAIDATASHVVLGEDDSMLFVSGRTNDEVIRLDLSTANDITTASHNSSFDLDVSGEEGNPKGISWNSDGTGLALIGWNSDTVYFYE